MMLLVILFGFLLTISNCNWNCELMDKLIAENGPKLKYLCANTELRSDANYYQSNPVERVHRVLKTTHSYYVNNDERGRNNLLVKVGGAI